MAWPSTGSFQTSSSSSTPGYTSGGALAERPNNNRINGITTVVDELAGVSTVPPGLRNLSFAGQPENYATGDPLNPGVRPANMRERQAGMPSSLPGVMTGGVLKVESYFNGLSGNMPIVPINIEAMVMTDGSHLLFTTQGHVTFVMTGEGEIFRSMTQNRQLTLIRSLEQFNMDMESYFTQGRNTLNKALRNGTGIGPISAQKLRELTRNDTSFWFHDPDFKKLVESNNREHRMLGYLSLEFIMQKWKMPGISAGQLSAGLAGMSCDVALCGRGIQEDVINVWGTKVRPLDTVGFILKFVNTYVDISKGERRLTGVSSPKWIPWHGSRTGPRPEEFACVDVTGNSNGSAVFLRLGTVKHFSMRSSAMPSERFNYAAQAGLIPRANRSNPINPIVEHKMTVSIDIKVFF